MDFKWNETHTELKRSMQKEVTLMRDLLANLHQEELSLLMHDKTSWNQIMEERSKIVQKLGSWRELRMATMTKLMHLFHERKKQEPPLEELLPPQDENTCEVLSLRDQIMALAEKMNSQNNRNQTLYRQVGQNLDMPLPAQPQPASASQKRRRTSVTTYHFKP